MKFSKIYGIIFIESERESKNFVPFNYFLSRSFKLNTGENIELLVKTPEAVLQIPDSRAVPTPQGVTT